MGTSDDKFLFVMVDNENYLFKHTNTQSGAGTQPGAVEPVLSERGSLSLGPLAHALRRPFPLHKIVTGFTMANPKFGPRLLINKGQGRTSYSSSHLGLTSHYFALHFYANTTLR